jgi:hypothetical protein
MNDDPAVVNIIEFKNIKIKQEEWLNKLVNLNTVIKSEFIL